MPRLLEQVSSRCCPSRDRGGGRDVRRREGAPAARAGAAGLCSAEEGAGMEGLAPHPWLPGHTRAGGNYRFTAGERGKLTCEERRVCKGEDFS